MPTFCRHNRLIQNCPICSREQAIELRPVLSSSAPRVSQTRDSAPERSRARTSSPRRSDGGGLRVRKLARGLDDGYRSALTPGLKSSADAERLAEELAFAAGRVWLLEKDPPGLYAEVAHGQGDLEERTWLAFLIGYLGPLDGDDPFASTRAVHKPWRSIEELSLEGAQTGPRTAHDPAGRLRTVEAYRGWAGRAGSQADAFRGEPRWTAERRFERVFERLSLPGLGRDARFDVLVTLGRLGLYDLRAAKLALGGENGVTLAAKRVFGIGDPLLLERRAADLAAACGVPIDALDLGLFNWGRRSGSPAEGGEAPRRATAGLGDRAQPDDAALGRARAALGL
jgi:hypothetical protein